MKQTGQLLRETREKRGITLNEVSMATKINVKVLEAMENGDIDNLPSKAFLRGFVQTYANYLKLDSKAVVQRFNEEMKFKKTITTTSSTSMRTESKTDLAMEASSTATHSSAKSIRRPIDDAASSSTGQKILIAFGVLAVVLIIKLLFTTIKKYENERRTPAPRELETSLAPSTHLATPPNTAGAESSQSTSVVQPLLPQTDSKTVAPSSTTALPAQPKEKAPGLVNSQGANQLPTSSQPSPKKSPSTENGKKALGTEAGSSIQNQELIVEALDRVKIVFSIDKGPSQRADLDTNKIQIIKAQNSISIEISDGGAVNVIFNGQDLGIPGTVGKPIKLNYP